MVERGIGPLSRVGLVLPPGSLSRGALPLFQGLNGLDQIDQGVKYLEQKEDFPEKVENLLQRYHLPSSGSGPRPSPDHQKQAGFPTGFSLGLIPYAVVKVRSVVTYIIGYVRPFVHRTMVLFL